VTTGVCNYVTCPAGHKIFVVWSPEKNRFAFTCDECGTHSVRAVSLQGVIEVKIVKKVRRA